MTTRSRFAQLAAVVCLTTVLAACASAPQQPEPTLTPGTTTSRTPAPAAPQRAETIPLESGRWTPVGPVLFSQSSSIHDGTVEGSPVVLVPNLGEFELDAAALLPDEEVVDSAFTYVGENQAGADGEVVLAGLATVRVPASGLDPEHFVNVVLGLSLDESGPGLVTRTEIFSGPQRSAWFSGSTADGFIAVNIDQTYYLTPEQGAVTAQLVGVDVENGRKVWERADSLEVSFGEQTLLAIEDYFGEACAQAAEGIDVATGDTVWRIAPVAFLGNPSGWECDIVHDDGRSGPFGYVYPAKGQGLDDVYDLVRVADGNRAQLPRAVNNVPLGLDIFDPVAPMAMAAGFFSETGLIVFDTGTGDVVYEIDATRAKSLALTAESLFGGLLYLKTTDEQIVVDVQSGEEIGEWSVYPVAQVGDYTLLSDDTLRLKWRYDGE